MPALTQFYRLTPMDIDQMSLREITEYVTQMNEAKAKEEHGG